MLSPFFEKRVFTYLVKFITLYLMIYYRIHKSQSLNRVLVPAESSLHRDTLFHLVSLVSFRVRFSNWNFVCRHNYYFLYTLLKAPAILSSSTITAFCEEFKILKRHNTQYHHIPVTSFSLGSGILKTLFWNTLKLCYSLRATHQVLRP